MARGSQTLADYIVIAISPALIMTLVGSLVFFLVEVLYVGQFQGDLLWVLASFVFGAVLIARISVSAGIAERAGLYGVVLGALVWIALQRFISFPTGTPFRDWGWAVNFVLIGIIWWSAHQLTIDCTLIDDEVDASGAGLLDEAGLGEGTTVPETPAPPKPRKKKKKRKDQNSALGDWVQRYRDYRTQRRRKPQAPGVWVVYFSLAALPLYGLGQAFIPAEDTERRRYAFVLLGVYVTSGLGLLLTTSFLGLRRYLRQRGLKMPVALAGTWLFVGGALIAAMLAIALVLPRPAAEVSAWQLPWHAQSDEVQSSRFAMRGDPGRGEGRAVGEKKGQEGDGKDKDPGGKGGDPSSDKGKSKGDTQTDKGQAGDKAGEKKEVAGDKGERTKETKEGPGNSKGEKEAKEKDARPRDERAPPPPPTPWTGELPTWLKRLVIALFAIVIAFILLRALLKFLANFTGWAADILRALAALWLRVQQLVARPPRAAEEKTAPAPRPFASFGDPFLAGLGDRPADLVRYTFQALEAWARDHGRPRPPDTTPLEFVEQLVEEYPALEEPTRRLAQLYVGLAYGGSTVGREAISVVRALWLALGRAGSPAQRV